MTIRQIKWDLRYLELARHVAAWSKDPSTKVGAVLVRPNNSIASTGFNGFPPGFDDSPELYADRNYKYQHVVHAEVNAINFVQAKEPLVGWTIYSSFPVCPDCVDFIVKAGISRIVNYTIPYDTLQNKDPNWILEWRGRLERSKAVAKRYGVELVDYEA